MINTVQYKVSFIKPSTSVSMWKSIQRISPTCECRQAKKVHLAHSSFSI